MPVVLDSRKSGFPVRFREFLEERRGFAVGVDDQVAAIIEDVRLRGDDALIELTRKHDRFEATPESIQMNGAEISEVAATVPPGQRSALSAAAERIAAYHKRQIPEDVHWVDEAGAALGWRWTALASVGLYAPGGSASYPSSVLMNAIPAKLAGVDAIAIAAPTPDGKISPLLALAAELSDVQRIYRVGGAQAIAALALGTNTVDRVDKITGPGNAYVTAAKRQLFGTVGIDMIAGPSEVVVIADDNANPTWIAADLLAQAEHDRDAQAVLLTTCSEIADTVEREVKRQLTLLSRASIAAESWNRHGAIMFVRDINEAAELSDRIAPEHLQLCVSDPGVLAEKVRHAGAIFLGEWSPEVIGDYVAGPNHVLPTSGAARFSSGLSVLDFMKRTSMVELSREAFGKIGPPAETLALAEGLSGHGAAVRCRLERWRNAH
ncbi:MAG: histidinol dehydrogenase [Rhodobacteraceae bacterium]|nr:histidinol dehydrogenase [Paracoccaceae bacterium]